MDILVVGAGAVGQVYGRHLALGGARVSFLVRAKYKDDHPDGFTIYPLRKRDRYEPVQLRPHRILSSLAEVKEHAWDQVWLCVATTALLKPWLEDVLAAIGDATLVLFPSTVDAVEHLGSALPKDRCVSGLISMMSYDAPLEGESLAVPGVAYWMPPLSPTLFSGPKARTDAVVEALRRGKCSAAAHPDTRQAAGFGGAVLITHIVALEGAQWSYDRLVSTPLLGESVLAAREAMSGVETRLGVSKPFALGLLRPWTARLVLRLLRWLAPFAVDRFFKKHFTKVREQTKLQVAEYIDFAMVRGSSTANLTSLADVVFGADWKGTTHARES
jgi:hypothetical protein